MSKVKSLYLILGIILCGLIYISSYFVLPACIMLIAAITYKEQKIEQVIKEEYDIFKKEYEEFKKTLSNDVSSIKTKINMGQMFGK